MLNYHQIVFALLCLDEAVPFHTRFTDFYVESIKMLNPKSIYTETDATLNRSGHEQTKLFMEIDLKDSIRNYESDVKIYYSPLGNRRFILLPFKVERKPQCESFELKEIQQVVQMLQNYSNVPALPTGRNVSYCDLLTVGHYYVHNFMVDKSIFPSFTPTGRYRLAWFVYRKSEKEVVQGMEFVAAFI